MSEIESSGPWPENVIGDINLARIELIQKMQFPKWDKFTGRVYLSPILVKVLDKQVPNVAITYRMFLIKNGLATIHEWENAENDVAVMRSEDHEVTIKNIRFNVPVPRNPCDFCPNTIELHREAVKLWDERLVCYECYAKVFEYVLQTLQGSAKSE